ncbi:MAG: proton-conducting transporter membrane subunit [Pirellulales bacterium]
MSEQLVLAAIAIVAVSGVVGLAFSRSSAAGQYVATALASVGSVVGIAGLVAFWMFSSSRPIDYPWSVPGGEFAVAVDGLSAIFLLPVFLVSLLGNIYGLEYWAQAAHPENGRKLRLFYGLVTAGMALLVVARNSLLFLVGWEIMALAAFFLVTTEDHDREVREAGWVYLACTHTATLCLFALFALLRSAVGSFSLTSIPAEAVTGTFETAVFALAVLGFGLKAGVMPLHLWLPGAHAMAPSHVSALMSGVLIKMGIYGLVRVTSLFPHPPVAWGAVLLGLGIVSGVLGVAYALGQHDLKRLLAYHSVENIGIIVMGLGLALMGRSLNRYDWIVLGLCGALLHVWNHALFKSLLFLSAGSVIHATHTREIDHLGGLAKRMPATAGLFLIGAVAICGLPPLNGFVSEFLLFLGFFSTFLKSAQPAYGSIAFAATTLALIGALAVACFVKVFATVFLGTARSTHSDQARESTYAMLGPMAVLAACCLTIGLAPQGLPLVLDRGVNAWAPEIGAQLPRLAEVAPLSSLGAMAVALVVAILVGSVALGIRLRATAVSATNTWSCAYMQPTPRMQYTSSSFAQMLVSLLAQVLLPITNRPRINTLFPASTRFSSEVPDAVLDRGVLPAFRLAAWLMSRLRVLQHGSIQLYLLYVFATLLWLLLWK